MTEKTVLGDIGHVKLAVELFTLGHAFSSLSPSPVSAANG